MNDLELEKEKAKVLVKRYNKNHDSKGRFASSGGSGSSGSTTNKNDEISQLKKKVDDAKFEDEGFGQWTLDVPGAGGASILDESSGGDKYYSISIWDKNYSSEGIVAHSPSLAGAKATAKELIKQTIK